MPAQGHVALLPWVFLRSPIQVDPFRFQPVDLDESDLDEHVRGVAAKFRGTSGDPVKRFTLVYTDGRCDRALVKDQWADLFEIRELMSVAAIKDRPIFENPSWQRGYVNSDSFQLVVQPWRTGEDGVVRSARRRDGSTLAMFNAEVADTRAPLHVDRHTPFLLDEGAVVGLVDAWRSGCDSLLESARLINLANTDSRQMREFVELQLMVASIQAAIECHNASGHEIAAAFDGFLAGIVPPRYTVDHCVERDGLVRIAAQESQGRSLRYLWMRDCYTQRGTIAHGRTLPQGQRRWHLHEHLALGSYLVPRLLVHLAASAGHYDWTAQDRDQVAAFDRLLCEPDLFANEGQGWKDALCEAHRDGLVTRAHERLEHR